MGHKQHHDNQWFQVGMNLDKEDFAVEPELDHQSTDCYLLQTEQNSRQ